MKHFITFLGASVFFFAGIIFLFWTEKVRNYYLENYERGLSSSDNIFSRWKNKYPGLLFFRFWGAVSIGFSLLIIYAWLRKQGFIQ
jgi:hypothetical protein